MRVKIATPIIHSVATSIGLSIVLGSVDRVNASPQIPDTIIVGGRFAQLFSLPLSEYLGSSAATRARLAAARNGMATCSILQRQYVGTWQIENKKLYLKGLATADCQHTKKLSLTDIFNDRRSPIFANWYSGTLKIGQGKPSGVSRGAYTSTFDRYLFIQVQRGLVIKTEVK
jgi:hypothetical protein